MLGILYELSHIKISNLNTVVLLQGLVVASDLQRRYVYIFDITSGEIHEVLKPIDSSTSFKSVSVLATVAQPVTQSKYEQVHISFHVITFIFKDNSCCVRSSTTVTIVSTANGFRKKNLNTTYTTSTTANKSTASVAASETTL